MVIVNQSTNENVPLVDDITNVQMRGETTERDACRERIECVAQDDAQGIN
jgi:hypothetical protein